MMPPTQYGRFDYSAVPALLRSAEALGFSTVDVQVKQTPTSSRVFVEFVFTKPEGK